VAQAIQRGRAFSGDVLAELARSDALDVLLSVALKSAPARVEDLWLVTSGVGRDAIAGLPVQVLRELLQRLEQVLARYGPRGSFDGRLRELAIEHERAVRLVVLAELFLRWPPLRGSTIDAREIDEIARIAAPSDRKQRGVERRSLAPSSSRAGGLAFWARLVDSLDIGLDGVFSTPRLLEGVRWAIARSLEDGSMDRRDPLLLAWIGSEPDSVVAPAMGLSGEDPEPLFRVAMQALLRHGEAPGAVHLCRWGDLVVAFAGDVVLDIFASRSPHDIVPDLVKRLRARGLGVVPELHVDSDAWGQVADVLAELDTPAIPDAWRGAVLALTSLLRRRVRETHRAGIRELRKWQARLHDDRTIELRSHEIRSIDAGRWLGDGVVRLAGNRHRVREVSQF
jgi:hypothetical protein